MDTFISKSKKYCEDMVTFVQIKDGNEAFRLRTTFMVSSLMKYIGLTCQDVERGAKHRDAYNLMQRRLAVLKISQ